IARPIQKPLKLPAVRPDRMLSDAPPSLLHATTSRTCCELVDVNIFTSSGMIAPASVPQVMMVDSFHHSVPSPISGINRYDMTYVTATEISEVIHTTEVSGRSKSNWS